VLRIIGGEWRGRKVRFPPVAAIRPTPDRVRETVFNWLQGVTPGSRCLDLYAGSGALGLEALSRGAREAVFVDVEPAVIRHLGRLLREFGCERGTVVQSDAHGYIGGAAVPFDVIFLDPPFAAGMQEVALQAARRLLADGGLIYLEAPAPLPPDAAAGAGLEVVRASRAGQVSFHLLQQATA
jgi:16S rRNA (guanine966-N2)-methyltransferase